MSPNSPVTWSQIATRRCGTNTVSSHEIIDTMGMDSAGRARSDRQQSQIVLLQQALRCPQDTSTGSRICLKCGRRYHDVFRLAQHIKDKHETENVQVGEKSGPVMSEFVQFPSLERDSHDQWTSSRENKKNVSESRKEAVTKTARTGTKKLSSLKKAYLREKTAQIKESWSTVLLSLNESIESLEEMKYQVVEEKTAAVVRIREEHSMSDWNQLEIVIQKEHMIDEKLSKLQAMKELCAEKIQTIENKYKRIPPLNRRKEYFGSSFQHKELEEKSAEDVHVEDGVRTAEEKTHEDSQDLVIGDTDDVQYDSDESISSDDDSFELQWGDTLQTWAQNMGHMNLKHLSLVDTGSTHDEVRPLLVAPEALETREDDKQKHVQATSRSGTVRVIATFDKRKPLDAQTPDLDVKKVESQQAEVGAPSWLHVEDLVPGVSLLQKPTACVLCDIPSLEPDGWEIHQQSACHRKKLIDMATDELGIKASMAEIHLTKNGNLSTNPKKYTGPDANVEAYVSQTITDDMNRRVSLFLSKLISWQERTKKMDPMNAKRKKRLVCGMREAAKAVKLGKVKVLIVAPNVQPLAKKVPDGGAEVPSYPVDSILQDCKEHDVPTIFALTRRKMGSLLGQRKNVSLFAVLSVDGAEDDLRELLSLRSQKYAC